MEDIHAVLDAVGSEHAVLYGISEGGPLCMFRSDAGASSRQRCLCRCKEIRYTGEIEVLEKDLAGIAVHIAARVMSLAGPGEILVSGTVKDLVVGSGIEFTDKGLYTLKGVPGEWRLYTAVL